MSRSSKKHNGSAKDLCIGLAYTALLAGLSYAGFACLIHSAHTSESTSAFTNLTWSDSAAQIAFVQELRDTSGKAASCRLWIADSSGENARLIGSGMEAGTEIIGWFKDDQSVITYAPDASGNVNYLTETSCNAREQKKYKFPGAKLNVIGCSTTTVYMTRPSSDSGQELMAWKPETSSFSSLASIPAGTADKIEIKSASVSADGCKIALAVQAEGQSNVPEESNSSADSYAADNEEGIRHLGVWIWDNDVKKLNWTTISAEDADDFSSYWSPDSSWLAGVAMYKDYSKLIFADSAKNDEIKMRNSQNREIMKPIVPSPRREIFLIDWDRIIKYNFETKTADIVFSSDTAGMKPHNIVMSPVSARIAFSAGGDGEEKPYVASLSNQTPSLIRTDETSLEQSLVMNIAEGIEYAANYWKNN